MKRIAALVLVVLVHAHVAAADSVWPQWRGLYGTGHSDETNLPVRWGQDDVRWIADLPGWGHSSPVAWGDRLFLTVASQDGRDRSVVCLDRRDGRVLWQRLAWSGEPEAIHTMNSWATPTCATDGERVVAFFGNGGLHCYDLEGTKRWTRDLGTFEMNLWGVASSPVIVDDLVIQTCDADNVAFLVGIDKRSGSEVWRTPRFQSRSFSTPVLIDTGDRRELVLNGHDGVHAYDPATGEELWYCTGASGRGAPSVVPAGGLVIVVSGRSQGERDLMAVRPGGSGDVTATHVVWSLKRGGRDLPSPVVVGDYLFLVNLRPGLASCYDVTTGKELWKRRMNEVYSASPIAANGLIYALGESGEVVVIQPDDTYQEVARNRLNPGDDEVFRASLMPYEGQIFCRSDKRLYCIGQTEAAERRSE